MDPSMLRLVWNVVEETQSFDLLNLPDAALVKLLLQRMARKVVLTREEAGLLYDYLRSRTSLIRDLAESRVA